MKPSFSWVAGHAGLLLALLPGAVAVAAEPTAEVLRLRARVGDDTAIRFQPATGVTRFVRLAPGSTASLSPLRADTFRIQAYDTTYRIPRFNNSATQVTVLLIANPTDQVVVGTLWFHDAAGTLLASQPASLQPKATLVLDTSAVPPLVSQAGTVTLSNDAPYGTLVGKAVALEPATGFTFDTPMSPRPATAPVALRGN